MLPGIVAAKLYHDAVGDATYAFPVRDPRPVGVSGLVIAGLLAAPMSTADWGAVSRETISTKFSRSSSRCLRSGYLA